MKNTSAENIRLELNKPRVKSSISVRQGDTATRAIHATLTNNGSVYGLENALVAAIIINKPDGTRCYNDCVISGNEIQYTITTQTISVTGECICQFEVTFDDGATVTSPEFSIVVYEKNISRMELMSQSEYTSITQQVVMAKGYAEAAAESETNAGISETNAAESAEASATSEKNAGISEAKARESAKTAAESEANAGMSEANALEAAKTAAMSAENAGISEVNASGSANAAAISEKNAGMSAVNAAELAEAAAVSEKNAGISAVNAAESAEAAAVSEANAEKSADIAKKYYEDFVASGQLALGEEHNNAFYGDLGKKAYEHSVSTGNPHQTTYLEVGADKEGLASECYQNAVAYTDQKIADLINGAPETLDTLKEIADAMADSEDVVDALDQAIGTKANQAQLDTHEANEVIHITAVERKQWNACLERVAVLEAILVSYGYPVDLTDITTEED